MIEVKRYLDRAGADVARTLLESCGIPARVAADNEGGMAPHLTYLSGVRLLVATGDAEEAREILAHSEREAAAAPHLAEAGDALLPPGPAATALKAALVGLVVFPVGLHLYSLWYAALAVQSGQRLSTKARRQLGYALAIDLIVLGVATLGLIWAERR